MNDVNVYEESNKFRPHSYDEMCVSTSYLYYDKLIPFSNLTFFSSRKKSNKSLNYSSCS